MLNICCVVTGSLNVGQAVRLRRQRCCLQVLRLNLHAWTLAPIVFIPVIVTVIKCVSACT